MSNKAKIAFLFLCHTFHPEIILEYNKILEATQEIGDTYLLFHLNDIDPAPKLLEYNPYFFSDESIARLNYPKFRETLIPGSTHFPLLQFFHDHTEYDYYWQIEYDVRFSGDWRYFFDSVSDWEEDFLSCHIRRAMILNRNGASGN